MGDPPQGACQAGEGIRSESRRIYGAGRHRWGLPDNHYRRRSSRLRSAVSQDHSRIPRVEDYRTDRDTIPIGWGGIRLMRILSHHPRARHLRPYRRRNALQGEGVYPAVRSDRCMVTGGSSSAHRLHSVYERHCLLPFSKSISGSSEAVKKLGHTSGQYRRDYRSKTSGQVVQKFC